MRNKIKPFLESRGLTAADMVRDARIGVSTGYKLVQDSAHLPSAKVLAKLCEAYDVQPGDLIER